MYDTIKIEKNDVQKIFAIEENYFYDFKAKDIAPAKLSKSISAFANSSGGELYIGIREESRTKKKHWEGFNCIEDCNAIISVLSALHPADNFLLFDYMQHPTANTYLLHISVRKTKAIIKSTEGKIFIRKNAQNIELKTDEEIHRLELDKGISSFEDETIADASPNDAVDSDVLKGFIQNVIPQTDGLTWIKKQHLCDGNHLTVAGTLLFVDEPQIYMPKRSAIKIFRYKTSGDADRDTLAETPITIEGCAYEQIYASVHKVKEIVESIKRVGENYAVYPIGWTVFLRLIGVNVLVCRPARGGAKPDRPYSSGGAGRVLRSPLDFV